MVAHRSRRRLIPALLIIGMVLLAPTLGCRAVMRLAEPRGAQQKDPVDPLAVARLGPWVKIKGVGLVASSQPLELRDYTTLLVDRFTVNPADVGDEPSRQVFTEIERALHEQLVSRLRDAAAFARVADAEQESAPSDPAATLRLQGLISRFDLGNRAARWLVGFGAGRTKLQVEARFVSAATGQPVLAVADRRIASHGFFGGDSRDFLLASVDEFTRALSAYVKRLAAGRA